MSISKSDISKRPNPENQYQKYVRRYGSQSHAGNEGWDLEETCIERLAPLAIEDAEGNAIILWNYTCANPELRDRDPAYYEEVFAPGTAESSRAVVVGEYEGTIYAKGQRCYLIWSISDSHTLLLDYDPIAVEEWELLKMAAICR